MKRILNFSSFKHTKYLIVVLVLLFCVNSAWGHDQHYFQGKAIAVNEGIGSGKVYVQQSEVTAVADITSGWGDEYETEVLTCKIGEGDASADNDNMYFCAKPNDGAYFWGWYGDVNCTEIMDDDPLLHEQILTAPTNMSSKEQSMPEKITLYAKFSDQPYPYRYYYGKLTANTDPADGSMGRVQANTASNDGKYGNWYYRNLAVEFTSNSLRTKSDEASSAGKIYATAVPLHGYKFAGWTTGANTAVSEGYDANNWQSAFDVTSTSTDPESPTVGVATAVFGDAQTTSVTLLKDANRGKVAVDHKYYYDDNGSVLENSAVLDTFALAEAKRTYSAYTKSENNYEIYTSDRITLTATPDGDYKFYGWYHEIGDRYEFLGADSVFEITLDEYPNYYAYFDVVDADNAFMVGFYQFAEWEDALAAAKANAPCNMLLLKDYTIPAGYYTIPEGVRLIIPKDETQLSFDEHPVRQYGSYVVPSYYRKLTLAEGVHLDVFGAIQAGGTQAAKAQIGSAQSHGASEGVNGCPTGKYGWLYMNEGSTITLEDGGHLYAWGYVTGAGEIDARRGSTVHECFQIKDWRGGTCVGKMNNNPYKVFPLNQYYIQNIESPITFRPGSAELCDGTVNAGSAARPFNDVNLIGIHGSGSLFEMDEKDDSEDTWVRKWYDAANDKQVYDINSAANLGSITLTLYGYKFTSGANYYLPITNNMKFHLLTGKLNITENAELLPGAEIEIDKEATVYINPGVSLYLFNHQEWDNFYSDQNTRVLPYSPSWAGGGKTCPRPNVVTTDAALTLHGTMEVAGNLHTTEHGANLSSSNADAGTIIYKAATPLESPSIYVANNTGPTYNEKKANPALLLNADGKYASTAGTPAGQSYCYMNGKWTMLTVDPENECFVKDNYNNYYAKPGAYVQLANGKTENADHTYSDAAGQGRLYILTDECQWWEVVLDNNLYKGITRNAEDVASPNGKYYAYNTTTHKWEEKRYTITWKDWDGTVITTYQLTYGVMPKYLSTNPTREANLDYTYDFTGWSPAIDTVAGDQIYTATYKETPVRYTITFKNSDGTILEHQFLTRGTTPTPPEVTNEDEEKILQWTPSIGAVTGNQIYTATWLEDEPTEYAITFYDYDGTTILKQGNVNVGDMPTEPAIVEGKPQKEDESFGGKPETNEFTYEFDHWSPANNEVVSHTSPKSFTAVYREVDKTYAIRFYEEDGTNQIGETQELALGADPEVPEYAKEDPEAGRTYKLQWKNKATDEIVGVSVPSVSGAADYVASFIETINRYTITAKSEVEGESGNVAGCTFTGAGTYNYGTGITLTAVPNEGYEFVKWKDNNNTDPARSFNVDENITYTAIVRGAPVLKVRNDETKVVEEGTKVSALVISATPTSSTDLVGANNLVGVNNEAVNNIPVSFDLTRGAGKVFKHHTWYAFSVPFQVNASEILFDGQTMQYGQTSKKDDYDILYYDGSVRATAGKDASCWKYVEKDNPTYLYPGTLYMIANTRRDVTTIRFTKVAGTRLLNTYVTVNGHESTTGSSADANWNGIANPAVFHANMSELGATEGKIWVYNPDAADPSNPYEEHNLGDNIILGQAFFVQTPDQQTLVVNSSTSSPAPVRRQANVAKERFQVTIAPAGGKATDNVIVRADEDKEEDKYIIGKDLVRMGMSKIRPQMWVNRYDEKLCVNVIAPTNGQAEYPLGIFAPADGEYTIRVAERSNEETTLYLTYDGRAVWNLSYGEYVASLEQGNDSHYGLRLVQKAPQVATGIDEAVVDAHGDTRKVLINDKVYIVRGEKVYSIDGQLVK